MESAIAELNAKTSTKELERELIKSFAGNYRVSFKFAETFAPNNDYEYHERHFSQAKEIAFILEETEDKISIQHVLTVGKHVIKHWRQDWVYENREILALVKDHEWKKITLTEEEAKGTWTQKVFQVDDCPRYEGYGTWVHVDGRHFWESTADAALPRREISKRQDYNVLKRNSHIEVFNDGRWMIEQDNEKILRDDNNNDTLICLEKGLEEFTPKSYDASETLAWWDNKAAFWTEVRNIWAGIIANNKVVNVSDDEGLYTAQFELAEQFTGDKFNAEEAQTAIKDLLKKHVEGYNG